MGWLLWNQWRLSSSCHYVQSSDEIATMLKSLNSKDLDRYMDPVFTLLIKTLFKDEAKGSSSFSFFSHGFRCFYYVLDNEVVFSLALANYRTVWRSIWCIPTCNFIFYSVCTICQPSTRTSSTQRVAKMLQYKKIINLWLTAPKGATPVN